MKRNRKPFSEGNNDDEDTGKLCFNKKLRFISISGVISWQLADEFFNILAGVQSLPSRKPLTIYINSEGGDAYTMFKVYDHIRNSPLPIVTAVTGYAFSAGFIIFLAGDFRIVFPNAFLGFHAPTIYYSNDYSEGPAEAAESAFHQRCLLNAMVEVVKENSNMSEKMIRKYFRILNRIDAKTALKFGLTHQIINPPKKILPKFWQKILKEQN